MTETYDTIVIGAGMSGLAAGIRLAMYDQRVLVLDRHSLWGGLNSFYKQKGHRFDVGLHALTNFVPKGAKGSRPLSRILRQLRLPYEALKLGEQKGSRVSFPGVSLRWTNDFQVLRADIADKFPAAIDGFDRLVRDIEPYPDLVEGASQRSARAGLLEYLGDPLLVDMLLLPLLYYGSPTPHDVEWTSFVILFKSLYEEGFARPEGGVRTILDLLRNRYRELGGTLKMNSGVARILHGVRGVEGVVLDDGTEVRARTVLSSAGYVETLRLCEAAVAATVSSNDVGALSFVEFLSVLDQPPSALGHDDTIVFFNTEERLVYASPAEDSVDLRSGVICCPDNYAAATPPEAPLFRLTLLASHARWTAFDDAAYRAEKLRVHAAALDVAARFTFDPRPHTTYVDGFTPRTIQKFTGHLGGAVYGSPNKQLSGRTPVPGLYLCGTDQGYLGIVGAMLSGIAMANQHALQPA